MIIRLENGNKFFEVDGIIKENDVAPMLVNDRTMVPLRFIGENLGMYVDYDEKTKVVSVMSRRKYFDTMHDCAFDWAMHFNAPSIGLFKEIGGVIYKDDRGYYWGGIRFGRDKCVYWDREEIKKGVAFIHSHGGGPVGSTDAMSFEDREASRKHNRPLYMVDSGGTLWVTDKSKENPITTAKSQEKIREGAPVDSTYVDMTESSKFMNEYFKDGYGLMAKDIDRGYEVDYFNMMYLKNIKYKDKFGVR